MNEEGYQNDDAIRVILQDLPHGVKGFCYHDDDGENFIVVNAHHSQEQQFATVQHEMGHIIRGEMYDPDYREYD